MWEIWSSMNIGIDKAFVTSMDFGGHRSLKREGAGYEQWHYRKWVIQKGRGWMGAEVSVSSA